MDRDLSCGRTSFPQKTGVLRGLGQSRLLSVTSAIFSVDVDSGAMTRIYGKSLSGTKVLSDGTH